MAVNGRQQHANTHRYTPTNHAFDMLSHHHQASISLFTHVHMGVPSLGGDRTIDVYTARVIHHYRHQLRRNRSLFSPLFFSPLPGAYQAAVAVAAPGHMRRHQNHTAGCLSVLLPDCLVTYVYISLSGAHNIAQ